MKKYNMLIVCSLLLYLGMALWTGKLMKQAANVQDYQYRIESNRILQELETGTPIQDIDLQPCTYIKQIDYIDVTNQEKADIQLFYQEINHQNILIQPLYQQDQLLGYVKFIYEQSNDGWVQPFVSIQVALLFMEIFMLSVLFYMKYHILYHFYRLKDLPLALAQGHFKDEIKAVKQPYLKSYVWGMSQLKDTLDSAKRRQLRLEKEKKQMLLSLSHDLKTPLNLISLYSKAIAKEVYATKQEKQQAALKIVDKVKEIETYVDTIMQTSREEILDLPVQNDEFYMQEFIRRMHMTFDEVCVMRNLSFHVGSCKDCLIKGDIDRYQEVVENIIENAFKYGDGRSIRITFQYEEDCLLMHIYNSGEIVSKQDFHHLFDSFYRGSNQTNQTGTGLGLYICKELMHKMDGDIYAQCVEDGMCFTLVMRCA